MAINRVQLADGTVLMSVEDAVNVSPDTMFKGTRAMNSAGELVDGARTLLDFYPVGSIYMSVNNTSPARLFGGSWEQIKDVFLLAAGDTYSAGSTGGEATHTLTVDEMPSHNHGFKTIEKKAASGTNYSRFASDGDAVGSVITETGGGQPHNNMPPYLAVFMWQRES